MIPDVLILGAGLAGLTAARRLHAAGQAVLVLDKGRGVGGRAATRRWDGVPVDHGAQFFTVRADDFRAMADDWLARGVCFEWTRGFHQWDASGGLCSPDPEKDQHPRYACRAGMSALAKDLAASLGPDAFRLGSRATAVRWTGDHWQAEVEGGTEPPPTGRRLVLALPVPQSLALLELSAQPALPATNLWINEDCLQKLRGVQVDPTLAVLLRGPAPAPDWEGIQLRDATLSWIGHDSGKRPVGGPGADRVFVLHGGADFSRQWQDADLDEAARRMVARAGEIVGEWITRLPGRQVHRWRFAHVPQGVEEVPFLCGTGDSGAPLYFAGDAFLGAKIEGACRSGMALGAELIGD